MRLACHRPKALSRRLTFGVTCAWLLVAAFATGAAVLSGHPPPASAAPANPEPLTGGQVFDALRDAGLTQGTPLSLPVGRGTPSGPPATEREALAFEIPGLAGAGGRILVYDDDARLQAKAAWFRRVDVAVLNYANVIVWLDPALPSLRVESYRRALQALP